ncbi:MAG: argininosuccinate synthase [Clostridia bacterium]|nr:argininosuccinate synthase [Clostridia bacterium]
MIVRKNKESIKKVVLAYSGGLDTSIIIPWLKENYNNCEVVCVSGNVGQASELDGLEEKALKTGASKLYIEDLTEEMLTECVFPCVQAGAKYEGYLLGTAFARPIIAKRIAEIAIAEGADAICHGCTGKGNDQVRFELAIKAFAPDMAVIAPWREWDIQSREEEIEYAEAHNIPLKINRETNYSKDKNIWHLSHEGMDLEDPANEPQYSKEGFLEMGICPEQAPDKPTYVTIHFEKGVPTAVNGEEMSATDLVLALNKLGGENGIGLYDVVENRLVGMKSRGVYETPGGEIIYRAHEVLETICIDKETQHYKALIAQKLAEQVYNGLWYSPLTEAIISFVKTTQKFVTGDVTLKLYKGNIINAGVTSPFSLYDPEIATFDEDEVYDQADSAGFINLFGLPTKVYAQMKAKNGIKD